MSNPAGDAQTLPLSTHVLTEETNKSEIALLIETNNADTTPK